MNRRNFMAGLAATPLAASFSPPALAGHLYWKPERDGHDVLLTSPDTAWKNAFHAVQPEYESTVPLRVPAGLQGTLYRNGPALMTLGGTDYRHWFDGDGMVHAFRFEAGRLRHHAKLTATAKLQAETAAGWRLAPGFGTDIPVTAAYGPEAMNPANINTLLLNGELLALGEGGAPYAIDPDTLATLGKKTWSPQTTALPFSAHPRKDVDGTVWSFGYLPGAGAISLYQLGADGALVRQAFLPTPGADMVHDFAITERYLVFVLMPYQYLPDPDPSRSFVGHYAWQAGQPGRVLVVDKATFTAVGTFECDPVGLFHLGNAWEVGNTLRFGVVRYTDFTDAIRRTGTALGHSMMGWSESRWTEFEVNLASKTVRLTPFDHSTVEFPRHDPRRTGRESRYLYLMASQQSPDRQVFGFDTLRRIDQKTAQVQEYHYGAQTVAEEHVFVPAPGSSTQEDRGWVIGTALDWKRRRTLVSIFDATQVAAGPIEQVALPYGLPLGLHGQFQAT